MSVRELGSAWVTPFDPRRRSSERRAPPRPGPAAPDAPPRLTEAAFLAPVMRADLSTLTIEREPEPAPAPPVAREIYTHLDSLVAAIRAGDLARARAVVETLETQMLVERSARIEPARPPFVEAAPAPRPSVVLQDVDASYETLAHYLVTDERAS